MSTSNLSGTAQNAHKTAPGIVPAVERAAAILNYLQAYTDAAACTVTKIATALGLHKSNCSNILRTLESATLVEYDPNSKAYMLGAALIGLGATATRRRDILQMGQRPIENLVRQTGLSCVTFAQLPDKSFLIIAGCDSDKEIKVTIDVGQYFAAGTPALARIVMATMAPDEIDAYITQYCQPQFTALTKTERTTIYQEIEQIRTHGYAISQGEYYAGNTAVVAPIFTAQDNVCRGICLIGFTSQMNKDELPLLGAQVRDTAQIITQAVGGHNKLPAATRVAHNAASLA